MGKLHGVLLSLHTINRSGEHFQVEKRIRWIQIHPKTAPSDLAEWTLLRRDALEVGIMKSEQEWTDVLLSNLPDSVQREVWLRTPTHQHPTESSIWTLVFQMHKGILVGPSRGRTLSGNAHLAETESARHPDEEETLLEQDEESDQGESSYYAGGMRGRGFSRGRGRSSRGRGFGPGGYQRSGRLQGRGFSSKRGRGFGGRAHVAAPSEPDEAWEEGIPLASETPGSEEKTVSTDEEFNEVLAGLTRMFKKRKSVKTKNSAAASTPQVCNKCGKPGHIAKDCRMDRDKSKDACHNCGRTGHWAADCPKA